MSISLRGTWKVKGCRTNGSFEEEIVLPGTINGSGLGEKISPDTMWNSGLHNPFWYEREEYKSGLSGEYHVPFLSQPPTFFAGEATYSRTITVEQDGEYYLFIELSKWKLTVLMDENRIGTKESLCAPFTFGPFWLNAGEHTVTVQVDNRMQHPYRPDGHGISDALNANWNGMGGEICLLTGVEYKEKEAAKLQYAKEHPVKVSVEGRNICINEKTEYMRGTHFGGDFPLSGMPNTDVDYWRKMFSTIIEWGFNFVRCHSYCPTEAAFLAADELGLYLQVECGMWNTFSEGNPILSVLREETKNILHAFGHHPSFVLFSPSNEPGGNWYNVLRDWVKFAKNVDRELGYEGRRVYTAQSGWYYEVPPNQIDGTDYIYFHRSAFGPIHGGMIRNHWGWRGKDYSPSLVGCKLPVISHEMGQWCSYPDFDVIKKFSGYAKPGNFEIFKESAKENDVLQYNKEFTYCSGKNQVRLLKEDFEANFRTPEITGYEYLDLHDYTGQGTALVGVLDPFWENKGYTTKEEFKRFNSEVVLLARIKSYVLTGTDVFTAPVEISNFGKKDLSPVVVKWRITGNDTKRVLVSGEMKKDTVLLGQNTVLGEVTVDFSKMQWETACENKEKQYFSRKLCFTITAAEEESKEIVAENVWELTVFINNAKKASVKKKDAVVYTKSLKEAELALREGKTVLFTPYLSDMDFECPNLSFRNVFWNAQMGPRWSRQLGIVVNEAHPAFRYFETGHSGGWEWEEIFNHARGFCLPANYPAIVRVIDDWNRNFPLSLLFEAKVLNGKLLFVSANLDGEFEERPAAATLRESLLSYAASMDFCPDTDLSFDELTKHLRPMYKGCDIIKKVTVNEEEREDSINIYDINPNIPFIMKAEEFPVTFTFSLRHPVLVNRLYCLPIQNDRDFIGVIRKYQVKAGDRTVSGEWKNSFETQWTQELSVITDEITFTVLSTYSMGQTMRFEDAKDGWHRVKKEEPLMISMAAFGVEYTMTSGDDKKDATRHNDEHFWSGSAQSRHKEIDL